MSDLSERARSRGLAVPVFLNWPRPDITLASFPFGPGGDFPGATTRIALDPPLVRGPHGTVRSGRVADLVAVGGVSTAGSWNFSFGG